MIELVLADEAREIIREDILVRIAINPFCPFAALLADHLSEITQR